ncbi:uncharacterized protein EI90DRAFT_3091989 [Cantharellus anzutake]|uniref:uncharacterized protein n=1 Tax=Cantharellus anzutake TaxID=1750568 RepID=UPI001908DF42|nr:uncharacterized protein EI90DRAFT_3091989 [Cantharellus anzutake]KAF8313336.1 hypothetical protein EI90DRAFT_3091989 [Cantharellus anzutake]
MRNPLPHQHLGQSQANQSSLPTLERGPLDENGSNHPSKRTSAPLRLLPAQVLGTPKQAKRIGNRLAKERQSIESRLQAKLLREWSHGHEKEEEVKRAWLYYSEPKRRGILHIAQHCASQSGQLLVISLTSSHVRHRYPLLPNIADFLTA